MGEGKQRKSNANKAYPTIHTCYLPVMYILLPMYFDETSRFALICLSLLVWSLDSGEYKDREEQQRRPAVKGGSRPMEWSRHALECLVFSYAEAGVSVFLPWMPNH